MTPTELSLLLANLIATWENEVIEFKQAGRDYDTDKIGEYFSAMANEANLRGAECAWLIFGIHNKTRAVVGSDYRPEPERLQSLKLQMAQNAEPSITLRNIFELQHPQGRVVLLEIPAAPRGMPVAWKGHYYARAGESLTSLGLNKLDDIRQQTLLTDWSAQVVVGATLTDLDEGALKTARDSFARKYANCFAVDEVMAWPAEVFLERARLTHAGKLTRTTLLLLGKPESAHLLSPHPAQMTWKLEGVERAYTHFGLPFLLNTTQLYQKVRNIQVRILPEEGLLAVEVAKYDQKVVLEALHNCIAHQDYSRSARIIVTEWPDKLTFESEGAFYDGTPDDYISGNKTPRRYRNAHLAQAMAELNMIDTMGYGIHEMHKGQARRYFPMPDFDLSEAKVVCMTIYGSVVNPAYSRILMQKTDLPLRDVLALDRVQKRLPIDDDVAKHLRQTGLIEGRKPNLHVSALVAKVTGGEADYIRTRAQDDVFYVKLVTDYLSTFGEATREEVDRLLWTKLSDGLNTKERQNKISNLLTKLRRAGRIHNAGTRKAPQWKVTAEVAEKKNKLAEKVQNKK